MSIGQVHLEPYIKGNSALHGLDARVKLAGALAMLITISTLPDGAWAFYLFCLALLAGGMLISRIPLKVFIRRAAVIELPLVLVILPVLFRGGGEAVWSAGLFNNEVAIYQGGLVRFSSLLAKLFLSILTSVLLSAATPFQDLLAAMRKLGLPRLFSAILEMMWRYLFVLVREAQRMLTARKARSSRSGESASKTGGTLAWRAKVTGNMAGTLMLRSIDRSERVYAAMKARGYDGEPRTLEMSEPSGGQTATLIAIAAGGLLVILLGNIL